MHYTNNTKRGFTLVELLIVIVVIAILAAISIVAFNGVQQRGRDSARQSDVSNIIKAMTAYTADDGSWPASAAAAKTALEDYSTANLGAAITDRITDQEPAPTDSDTRNRYQYTPLCTSGAPSGALITWFKEQDNSTPDATAGTGDPCTP